MTTRPGREERKAQTAAAARRWLRWGGSLAVIVATLAVLGGLAWWKYREIQIAMATPPPEEMPVHVGLVTVETLTHRNITTAVGTILAPRSITLNNELAGTVAEVLFTPGSIVEEGQVLVRLDISVEQAQLAAVLARQKFAASTLERNRQLANTDAITRLELEELESVAAHAQAQVDELRAVIAQKTIAAPFRARVGLNDTHKGQYLPAGTLIATLQSVEDFLLVDFMLPQGTVNFVQLDQTVDVMTPLATLPARLIAIDSQADRTTRNVRARARLDQPPATLLPGDSAQVRVPYGEEVVLPAVPAESVRRTPQGTFVFVAETNTAGELRVSERAVVPAAAVGSLIGLATGIRVGEQVVKEGSFKLQDGGLIVQAEIPEAVEEAFAEPPPPAPAGESTAPAVAETDADHESG